MQLSIIIVSYNVKYFLEQCLSSVQKAARQIEAEILVVDNASSDGSVDYLAPAFPSVKFISNTENTGYARANNQALRAAGGKYILFLNPDTIIPEGCLQRCIRFMESNALAGACGLRMLDGSGRYLPESKRGFPTLRASFFKLTGLTALFPHSRLMAGYYLGHLSELEDQEADVLAGAFFFTSKAALSETGGFDEQFFMYGEDIDLSYRLRQSGRKLYYLANPPLIHFKGESTQKGSLRYVKMFYRAMGQFVRKHYGRYTSSWVTWCIEGSIWLRASITAAGSVFRRQAPARQAKLNDVIVVGSEDALQQVTAILGRQTNGCPKPGHVNNTGELEKAVYLHQPDGVIFCEGSLSYQEIIDLMEKLPKNNSFWIHSAGTRCIVGSNSEHRSGSVLK